MLRFRPLLVPTLWFAAMFATLTGLGTWQVERLHWKEALIGQMTANLSAPALSLEQILRLPVRDAQYRRVALTGRFDHAHESYAFATAEGGDPVYHVLTPFLLTNGKALIVDRGMIPQSLKDPATRPLGQVTGVQHITGIWRTPDAAGSFTPKPDLQKRLWFARDVSAIAAGDGLTLLAPVIVEADATPNPGGWPKGGQTVVRLPNNHLQYAITWYLMALGLVAVYLVYHRQKGRLGWGA